jgi:hypothetical protein
MSEQRIPIWRKARLSDGQAMCVEFAMFKDDTIGIRDSKNPTGSKLQLTRPAWTAFLTDAKAGRFDL